METGAKGKRKPFSWVTDLPVKVSTAMRITRADRARWRMENETFSTLKNAWYNPEHKFGHGRKHLSDVLASLTMLAFLIDPVERRCCAVFPAELEAAGRLLYLREEMRSCFLEFLPPDWETLCKAIAIAIGTKPARVELLDTS